MFADMGRHIIDLDGKIDNLNQRLLKQHNANPVSRLLAEIPGVGPITAITMALMGQSSELRVGTTFCRLARPDTQGALHRRQTANW